MKKKFNYTIAYKRRDKGFKAVYRYTKNDTCINDSSYYNYIIINCEKGKVIYLFNEILKNMSIDSFHNQEIFKCYNLNIYNIQSGKLVGPVSVILLNSSIIIKFHPLMKNEIIETFETFKTNSDFYKENKNEIFYNDLLNNFTLIGPRTGSVLFKILKSLVFKDDNILNNMFNALENKEKFEKELHYLKEGSVIIFRLRKPSSNFKMNELIFNKITNNILNKKCVVTDEDMIKKNMLECIDESNIENSESLFNSFNNKSKLFENIIQNKDEDRYSDFNIPTERTVFQHRRKVKIENLNKKVGLTIRNKSKIQNLKMQMKKDATLNLAKMKTSANTNNIEIDIINQVKEANLQQFTSSNDETYFILIKNTITSNGGNNNPVYNLIFPHGFSVDLIRRFVYLQSRPIGLCELNFYLTESNNLIFPNDYPSTLSYQKFIKQKTIKKIQKYCKFPASKRVNYQKIANPFPFYASWGRLNLNHNENNIIFEFDNFNKNVEIVNNLLNKNKILHQFKIQKIKDPYLKTFIIPIYIEMIGQGIPRYNSLICLPTENDMINLIKQGEIKNYSKNYLDNILNFKNEDNGLDNSSNIKLLQNLLNKKCEKLIEPTQKTETKNKILNLEFKTLATQMTNIHNNSNTSLSNFNYSTDILEKDLTVKLPQHDTTRKIIGFITTGQFSYLESKGIGRGFIILNSYENLVNLKNDYKNQDEKLIVLIRNKNSRMYNPAKIQLLSI